MYTAGVQAATVASRAKLKRVLVVDSDSFSQRTIREALHSSVSEIAFLDLQEAWARVHEHALEFSVVLIDVAHAENAFSFLEAINRAWPKAKVVFFSNDMQFWMESIQRGAYDMLPKPLNGPDLSWIVDGVISHRGAA